MTSTIQWSPPNAEKSYGDREVMKLYAVAHDPVMAASSDIFAPSSNKQTNHWVFLFQISQNESVTVDPSLGDNGRLSLTVEVTINIVDHNSACDFILTPHNLNVNVFFQCVTEARYDRYKFAPSGQGCRHWLACVLQLLKSKGYLSSDDEVEDAIQGSQVVWNERQPVPKAAQTTAEKGSFF